MAADPQSQIVIHVWLNKWVGHLPSGRISHPYYAAEEAHPSKEDHLGQGYVRGTKADLRAWQEAAATFTETLESATRAYQKVLRSWWRQWLPGSTLHAQRARQEYQRATEAAKGAYQPVHNEIERRLEAGKAEREARRKETLRQIREMEAEQERLRKAFAQRAIWGFSLVNPTTVRVFESTEQGLTAAELEQKLRDMYESGARTVEWDPAARNAAAQACALPAERPSDTDFQDWWKSVSDNRWDNPETIPPPRPAYQDDGSASEKTSA